MGLKYLFDTNVFIDYFSDRLQDKSIFDIEFISENEILISPIVRMELLSHPNVSENDDKLFTELLNSFKTRAIDIEIENKTILLRKKYKLKLPDSIIAATVIVEDAILVTRDKKDFQKVEELTIL